MRAVATPQSHLGQLAVEVTIGASAYFLSLYCLFRERLLTILRYLRGGVMR
jgi:hypothetical protein